MSNYRDICYYYACKFRQAIERAKSNNEFHNNMMNFPYGCCDLVSDLLKEYLKENGIFTKSVCGTCYGLEDGNQSHCWLEIDDLIIDITGDQFKFCDYFGNYNHKVYVGYYDVFHNMFEHENVDGVIYDFKLVGNLLETYKIITKYID